jgi:hypothetical protein
MEILSLAIGFVVGGFTGAAGTFYGNKYTDQRREAESRKADKKVWDDLRGKFPVIINEMIEDVKNPNFFGVRTFFIKTKGTCVNSKELNFEYHTDVHSNLNAAIMYMNDLGYITDITPKNCPKYRFHEHFYEMLKSA